MDQGVHTDAQGVKEAVNECGDTSAHAIAGAEGLPPEGSGYSAPKPLAGHRRALAAAVADGVWRTEPAPQQIVLANVRALRFDPPAIKFEKTRGYVLHFHGGAFRIGAPEVVAPYAAALAARCGVTAICPAYRLAPEHPFPAALNDALAVLDALATGDLPLFISGDSAGGGLAASLTALAVAQGRRVDGLILLSAWLDLTLGSDSYASNAATDPLFSIAAATEAAEFYLQGQPAEQPFASPLLGSVAGFPPTLLSVGSGEVLLRDSERFHAQLGDAGVAASISAIAGMEHVAVIRGFELPGAAATFTAVTDFIDTALIAAVP